jgi:hypothetical protein
MCRSIKQLRQPTAPATEQEIYEAALQYVRKISGYRSPSRANSPVFEAAVQEIARSTRELLAGLEQPSRQPANPKTSEVAC